MQKKLRVFETFAGIGAQHKALENIKKKSNGKFDYEVVAISEWDISALLVYNAIHGLNTKTLKANKDLTHMTFSKDGKTPYDINKLSQEEYIQLKEACDNLNNIGSIVDIHAKDIPDHDLLTYSFPCQDLSIASMGKSKGMKKGSNTRSGLLWEIERILKELNEEDRLPDFLLMENVPAIKNSNHIDDFNSWLKELKNLGYESEDFILNAQDFGIPQKRKRCFCISVKKDKYNINNFTKSNILNHKPKKDIVLKDIINLGSKYEDEVLLSIPNNTPSRRKMQKENDDLDKINVVRTITTKQDRHPNAGMKKHNLKNIDKNKFMYRFLTPRECYMLMGFTNEDFDKVKTLNLRKEKLYQQAGNSIVVNILEAIFMLILKEFYD